MFQRKNRANPASPPAARAGVSRRHVLGGLATSVGLIGVSRPAMAASNDPSQTPGFIYAEVGTGVAGFSPDGSIATSAMVRYPTTMTVDAGGNLVYAEGFNNMIRKVDVRSGQITTIGGQTTGGYNGDGLHALDTLFNRPTGVAFDPCGNLIVADELNQRVRRISAITGIVETIAGTGEQGAYNGDNIPGTSAPLVWPVKVNCDRAGNVYLTDRGHQRVRKVDGNGIITTVAGNGGFGYNGDNQPAINASLKQPIGIWLDCHDNMLICDQNNHRVRRVDAITGTITTIAGTGVRGYNGDNLPATSSELDSPYTAMADTYGHIYIQEKLGRRVRRIDADTGIMTTIAGTGEAGDNGDNQPATSALMGKRVRDLLAHPCGDILIADGPNHRIRRIVQ